MTHPDPTIGVVGVVGMVGDALGQNHKITIALNLSVRPINEPLRQGLHAGMGVVICTHV